jgi:hypothetical protein
MIDACTAENPLIHFSTLAYMGSHICARALLHLLDIIDVVWLYRSPIPVGGWRYFNYSNDLYLPSRRLEEKGGGQHPVGGTLSTSDEANRRHKNIHIKHKTPKTLIISPVLACKRLIKITFFGIQSFSSTL